MKSEKYKNHLKKIIPVGVKGGGRGRRLAVLLIRAIGSAHLLELAKQF